MAIMSLMAWQGVDGIVRAREANQVRLEQTLRLETVIAQWEQDLASLQETTARAGAHASTAQTLRLTRRSRGRLQVVVWSLRPRRLGLAALGRPGGDDDAATAGELAAQPAVPGQRAGQLRALDGARRVAGLLLPGQRLGNCQSSGDVVAPPSPGGASAPRGGRSSRPLPSGVRLVLAFAPGSGLSGSLVRDTLIAP